VQPTDPQSITNVLKKEGLSFEESLFENFSCSREEYNSLNSSTYYYLYHNLFNGLIFQEATHYPIQIKSIGSISFKLLYGGNMHMEDREEKAYSHEYSTTTPYQHFSWDEGNVVADVYQMIENVYHFLSIESLLVQVAL